MSLTQVYEDYCNLCSSGEFCKGENCNGWIVTDLDIVMRCGCGKGSYKTHPNYEPLEEEQSYYHTVERLNKTGVLHKQNCCGWFKWHIKDNDDFYYHNCAICNSTYQKEDSDSAQQLSITFIQEWDSKF